MKLFPIVLATCLWTCLCAAAATPAAAQDGEERDNEIHVQGRKNSAFCEQTFFTNSDDRLDFRGSDERRCFDMKGGADILMLKREDFPAGVEVSTGTGRDTVWATDGPDRIEDPDGRDKEIRTYGGDDLIDIRVRVDEDPLRGVETTPRTRVAPGSGTNTIMLGRGLYSNAFARRGFNIDMEAAPGADDTVGGVCGRPADARTYDLRSAATPVDASVKINTFGCGIGLFGVRGTVEARQIGGRFSLETVAAAFGETGSGRMPRVTGRVSAGTSLLLNLGSLHPASDLGWEGAGGATIRNRVSGRAGGGHVEVRAGGDVFYQGAASAAPMVFDLASRSGIELRIDAAGDAIGDAIGDATGHVFDLAARRMDITWVWRGGSAFPRIRNREAVAWTAARYRQPRIAYLDKGVDQGESLSMNGPDAIVNPHIPEGVEDNEPMMEDITVRPGPTRLTLVLRSRGGGSGNCARVRVIDTDGDLDDRTGNCRDPAAPVRELRIGAADYERIRVEGPGAALDRAINGNSEFAVDRLVIRY